MTSSGFLASPGSRRPTPRHLAEVGALAGVWWPQGCFCSARAVWPHQWSPEPGSWLGAGASAAVTGVAAAAQLTDRDRHDQTLSLSDPAARAAWLNLAGSALTVTGMGVSRIATTEANIARLARAEGIANTLANGVDTAYGGRGAPGRGQWTPTPTGTK